MVVDVFAMAMLKYVTQKVLKTNTSFSVNVSITLVGKPVTTAVLDIIKNSGNLQQLGTQIYVNPAIAMDMPLTATMMLTLISVEKA